MCQIAKTKAAAAPAKKSDSKGRAPTVSSNKEPGLVVVMSHLKSIPTPASSQVSIVHGRNVAFLPMITQILIPLSATFPATQAKPPS